MKEKRTKYKYKMSVVIPVYNVEAYLAETIDSVLNQTMNFEQDIQIILVNDGSPDNSEGICLRYKEMYPNNIVYVKQKNAGVSAARNNGISYIEGKYVNFLDSDDKWEKDVFEKAYKMFEARDDVDVIGVRQKFFEALNSYPSLDYKFDEDKVVDIFNDYDHIQLSVTSGFFRTSAIGEHRYDTRVKYSEDAKFIFEILMEKGKLGIIASSVHYYRRRFSENSAIQTKNFKDDWYLITPTLCYKYVMDLSIKKFGYVIPMIQYYIMYDYQFRSKEAIPDVISDEVKEKYMEITRELISKIDDNIILEQRTMGSEYKCMFMQMKYKEDVREHFLYVKHMLRYKGQPIINLENENLLNLTVMNVKKDTIQLKGFVNFYIKDKDYDVFLVKNNREKIKLELKDTQIFRRRFFNEAFIANKGFVVEVEKNDIKTLHFELIYKSNYVTELRFITGIDAKIDMKKRIFYIEEDKIYTCCERKIKVVSNNLMNRLKLGVKNVLYNFRYKKWRMVVYRMLYHIVKLFHFKKIWIISDRPFTANDNGYAFFQYVNSIKTPGIKKYFVITKDSQDFEKVKKTGKYLIFNSLKYKIFFLLADKIISSQADPWVTNPFGKSHRYYHDLYKADFVFLQHGIIKDDLSVWLNEYEKNMKMFVTSAQKEYDSIIDGNYGYDASVVKLTGLPRYDLLENKAEKKIAIMPTWRTNLSTAIDRFTGKRERFSNFNKSEYFEFYNKLINDERLLDVLKKNEYTGSFIIHPSHISNIDDFRENEIIKVERKSVTYTDVFANCSLIVTDYSSIAFDFAYLNKPVIYTHFDREEFFKNQIYDKGYYDYEKMGFGPVLKTYDETVDEIIKYIENSCKVEDKYKKRIDDFYKYHDRKNCERVYNEIRKIK